MTAVMIAFNADSGTVERVTAVITAGGVLAAYIIGEAVVDANREYTDTDDGDEGENDDHRD